jgi:RNA-directed DNA polymerase
MASRCDKERRKWCFAVLAGSHAQRTRSVDVRLIHPTEIPIRRYVKVKSDANPFDSHWRGYFESRRRFR